MNLKIFHGNDRAVSPVVGVALLIAMTVILAGVISFVVMGLGSEPASSPQASFDFDYDGASTVNVTHEGGDAIPLDEVVVRVDGADTTWSSAPGDPWSAGQTMTISANTGDEVRIVWSDPDSEKTTTLATYTV